MTDHGTPPKVKDRWYKDHLYRQKRDFTPRTLKVEPQFKFDDLYISPFNYQRRYDDDGRKTYVPVEVNRRPTGIHIMDDLLCTLAAGNLDVADFCNQYGIRHSDLDGLLFLLTGMRGVDFRQAYQLRLADDLLRYTSLPVPDVARRCGYGSRVNLYYAYKRDLRTSPTARREQLRQEGDEDRFRIEI